MAQKLLGEQKSQQHKRKQKATESALTATCLSEHSSLLGQVEAEGVPVTKL